MEKGNRPEFHPRMTIQEFNSYYWYKEELKRICLVYNLSSHGIKAELENRLKGFLAGEFIIDDRKQNSNLRKSTMLNEITLDTKLISEGFKFNQQAREFFKRHYKVSTFSFTKHMASALREAERRGDQVMTVADLIKVYEEGKRGQNEEKVSTEDKTYQWNNFVKDFNKDKRTKGMSNRMKVAAFLWQQVKLNPGSKEYCEELLIQYNDEIQRLF